MNDIGFYGANKEQEVEDIYALLDPSIYLIYGPNDYYEKIIEDFFRQYLNKKICRFTYVNE